MAEEFLHLLDRHSFSNGICCEGSAEFVGVNAMHVEALSDFTESQFYGAYGQSVMGS